MITYHPQVEQGSDEWFALRCGRLTASEMKHIITPGKLQYASNEKERTHLYELAAQRLSGYVEPQYVSDDMMRGMTDEVEAKLLYIKHYGPVEDVGFVTNDKWGFTIGWSPDGLINNRRIGLECKSRRQKFQIECIANDVMPNDFLIQVQTAMLVGELDGVEFISYSAGHPMLTKEILPDIKVQTAIIEAAGIFEEKLKEILKKYTDRLKSNMRLIPTERKKEEDISI